MIIDFDESYNSVDDYASDESGSKKKYKGPVALSALVIVGALFLQNTLAANISLGTGAKLEFGQGVQVTTACSGSDVLTLTPNSSFVNSSGNGSYYLSSVTVSGIPTSCQGVDFNLSVYDSTTSTALPIFATSKTVASIWNNAGTFQVGSGSSEATITSGSGTFTITFPSPVALASAVSRVTLQSVSHVAYSCAADLICNVGDISASGGTIFYKSVNAFTETGTVCASSCRYLEWAPSNWMGGAQDANTIKNFWQNGSTYVGSYVSPGLTSYVTKDGFGYGYANTNALIVAGDTSGAPTLARAYAGPKGTTAGQWFVPSKDELLLARNSSIYGVGGFYAHIYQTSSQVLTSALTGTSPQCWSVNFDPGGSASAYEQGCWPNNPYRTRAVRAF
jgi:hypothetical protein